MTYLYNAPNLTSGIDEAMVDLAYEIPTFIPMLLLFVYCSIALTGAISQKKKSGYSDVPLWCTIAGIGTMMVALVLSLTSGFIDLPTLSVVAVVTIFSAFWLFMSRNRNEV